MRTDPMSVHAHENTESGMTLVESKVSLVIFAIVLAGTIHSG